MGPVACTALKCGPTPGGVYRCGPPFALFIIVKILRLVEKYPLNKFATFPFVYIAISL